MAMEVFKQSSMKLKFETGVDELGRPVYKSKTYAYVKNEATVDQVKQAADALGSLSTLPLGAIERSENFEII